MTDSAFKTVVSIYKRSFRRATIETSLFERIIFYLSLGITLFISLFPVYIMFVTSITPKASLYNLPPTIVPSELTGAHYWTVLFSGKIQFISAILNSLLIATATAAFSVGVATLGAYSIARLRYPGRGLFSRAVLVVYMFSGILLVVPLFKVIATINLVDSLASLFITYLVFTLPISLYMLGNYFRSIPPEIEEAALMDGYSRLEVIWKITIPLSAPAIVAVFIYAFLLGWNEYLFASIFLKSEGNFTVPIATEFLTQSFQTVWGEVMAASVIASVPVIVLFMYLEKYMVEGLSTGGVEG